MSYKYFENKECDFYPCHNLEKQNCLFCFCPLYTMECDGDYEMIPDKKGGLVKDCSNCVLPHLDNGYDYIVERIKVK